MIELHTSWHGWLMASVGLVALAAGTAAAQEEPAQGSVVLPPVTVEDQAPSPVGPDIGYVATSTFSATKTDTPLREVPQSISVITRQQLDDQRVQRLSDALRYTAGVTPNIWGRDERFDQFLIRGFDIGTYAIYRDDLPQKIIGFSGFTIEPYGLERLEVIKGPASVLYGENEMGGMVNAVTKRPTDTPFRSAYASYGSFNTLKGGADVGGPVGQDGKWSYRLTTMGRDGETETDFSENNRFFVAPALTWQPNDRTSLTLLGNYQWDDLTPTSELPVAGVDFPAEFGSLSLSRSFSMDSDGFKQYQAEHGSAGYLFTHALDDQWTVRQNLRFSRQDTDYRDLYYAGVMLDETTAARTIYTVDETATAFSIDNQAEYKLDWGRTRNTLLAGFSYDRFAVDGESRYGDGPNLDILDPDYSIPIELPPIDSDQKQTVDQYGLYLQSQTKVDEHWILTLGARQTWVVNAIDDRLNAIKTDQDDNAFSGKAGLGYLFDNGLTPYVSYAESFVTNIGTTRDGTSFEPSDGTQYEVGLKYEPTFFPAIMTLSAYQIEKTNVLTTDPTDPNFQVQTGEVRHRGIEAEANLDLGFGLSAIAAYTYLDAEITSSNDGDEGNRPSLVPEHQASLWANYAVPTGVLEGLSFGAGVRYIGQTYGDNANTIDVDGYTLVDAAIRYRRAGWELALNASNLFDKDYDATCYEGGCFFGDGRNITTTLSVNF